MFHLHWTLELYIYFIFTKITSLIEYEQCTWLFFFTIIELLTWQSFNIPKFNLYINNYPTNNLWLLLWLLINKVFNLGMREYFCFHDPLYGGHWVIINITNKHFIHAGLERGPDFLSIYLIMKFAHVYSNQQNYQKVFKISWEIGRSWLFYDRPSDVTTWYMKGAAFQELYCRFQMGNKSRLKGFTKN